MSTVTRIQDITINVSGTAQISAGQNCIWITNSDGNSYISITNLSKSYQCKLSISGAPEGSTIIVNGSVSVSMNGILSIAPNSSIDCSGNYGGAVIKISNISNHKHEATVNIVCNKA